MKKVFFAAVIAFCLSNLTFADNQNVGMGNGGIQNVTIKQVVVLSNNIVQFQINESSSVTNPVPAGRQWFIDANTAWGKNALLILLTAKACGSPVMFLETTSQTWGWGCSQVMICNWI